jgi:ligand-binding SRPBCC domain-containing protein
MPGHTLTCELVVPATIGEVFAFFENPYNLAKITPPWLNFRILTPNLKMRLRAEIDYQFRWLGLPLKWRTVISEYDAPYSFIDEAISSPYLYWRHEHEFRETPKGTLVSDRVDYDLPYGRLGKVVHAVAVQHQLKRIFEYRQSAISDVFDRRAIELHPPNIATAG